MATRGATLCVLRARFFRFDVRRFGTAMGLYTKMVVRTCLFGGPARGAERVPAGVGRRRTITRAGIQVGTAPLAEALAVGPALEERRCDQQPLLTDSMPEIQLVRSGVDHEHIRILRLFARLLHEDEMRFITHLGSRIGQAPPACSGDFAGQLRVQVETIGTGRRETAGHMNAFRRQWITFLPDRVGSRQVVVDRGCMLPKRPDVKGQHSQETYSPRWPRASPYGKRS